MLAKIRKAKAEVAADEARLARAEVNVAAACAKLSVAKSEEKRLEALVGYLKLLAPFDGVVVAQRQYVGLRPAPNRRSDGRDALSRSVARREGGADLRD